MATTLHVENQAVMHGRSRAAFGVCRTIQTPQYHLNSDHIPAMATTVKKTYSKRTRTIASFSFGSPGRRVPLSPANTSRKRARDENDDGENAHPAKRQNTTVKPLSIITNKNKNKQPPLSKKPQRKPLTQLQLALSTKPALRSCDLCGLSYTHGTPEDECLHKSHCARVTKGMEWGREEEKAGILVVQEDVGLKGGKHGRIISFRADASGKIGTKVSSRQVVTSTGFNPDYFISYLKSYLRSISLSQHQVLHQKRWPPRRPTCSLCQVLRAPNGNISSGA